MRSVSIEVRGRVQGVWFRKYTYDQAQKLNLNGFVKNRVDGSVYIEASGPALNIDTFIKWCHKGSPLSNVDSVTVCEIDHEQENPFTIKS